MKITLSSPGLHHLMWLYLALIEEGYHARELLGRRRTKCLFCLFYVGLLNSYLFSLNNRDHLHPSGEKLSLSAHPCFIKSWEEPGSWIFRTFDDTGMCPSRESLLGSLQDAL